MSDPAIAAHPAAAAPAPRKTDDIVIGIVGSGGDGVISSGELLVSAAAAEGLYATIFPDGSMSAVPETQNVVPLWSDGAAYEKA